MKSRIIPLAISLALASSSFAALSPVAITPDSYTADVVVEKNASPSLKVVTTASVDNGTNNTGNTWMELGFDPLNPGNGLPPAGTVLTPYLGDTVLGNGVTTVFGVNTNNPSVTNYSFQLPPDYTKPNGILIDTVVPTAAFTLTTPAAYTRLSFAGSGGNGGDVVGVVIRHQDGTVETYNPAPGITNTAYTWGCPDWFSGTSNVLFIAAERCNNPQSFTFDAPNINNPQPRLYFRDIVVTNTTSPITNVGLNYFSGAASSHNAIFALSGAKTLGGKVTPITVTGYTYDFIVEAAAAKRGRILAANGIDNATSQSMDAINNTGNAWFERGFNINNSGVQPIPDPTVLTNTGLPAAGSLITNATGDRVYRMPPDYTTNNAVWVAIAPAITNATITLVTPTAASVMSLLGSAGNGPVNNINVVIHHADASTETLFVNFPNWFDGDPYVFGANGRVAVDTAQFNNINNAALDPRLNPIDLVLANTNSPVTSMDVFNTNLTGGRIAIFALSSTTGAVLPIFVVQPTPQNANPGANLVFAAVASANAAITYRWQKGTNGVFVNLSDGGNIAGSTTTNLNVNNVSLADAADYRCVATDSAGSANSSSAALLIISPLNDVTSPSDVVSSFGITPFGDGAVGHTFDNDVSLKLGGNLTTGGGPSGVIVAPIAGPTIVSGIRIYSGNDTVTRDPTSFTLEGSLNGGATYTLITSNALALPDGRNVNLAAGTAPNPLTQFMSQVLFANTNGYTSYRLTFRSYKGGGGQGSMQLQEAELLGVADTSGRPFFTIQPASVGAFVGASAFFDVAASGTPAPYTFWEKGTNGVYVRLADGGRISGSQTPDLVVNSTVTADAADYICVATNINGIATSSIAKLFLVSTNQDVTQPGDVITAFGGEGAGNGGNGIPGQAIDNFNSTTWQNGGSGLNSPAGFAPFGGPVGLIVTPTVGTTRLVGLRIYTSSGNPERDPADYKLEGSNDGGTNYTVISQGALSLPAARANNALAFDPTVQPMQEILFSNPQAYAVYRLTFNHTPNDNIANSLQIGELELLGLPGTPLPPSPVLTVTRTGTGFTISTTLGGTLYSTTNLNGTPIWASEGPITTTVTITPTPGTPQKYYQIRP